MDDHMEISQENQYWNPMFPDVLLIVLAKITPRTIERFFTGRRLEADDVSDASLVGLRILYPSIELPSVDCLLKLDPQKYRQHHDWRARKYRTEQEHLSMIRVEAFIKDSIQLEPACVALLGREPFTADMSTEQYYANLNTCTYAFLITQTGKYMPVKRELVEALMVEPVLLHTDTDRLRHVILHRTLLKRKYEMQGQTAIFLLPAFPFWVTMEWFEEWLAKHGSLKDRIHGRPKMHKQLEHNSGESLSVDTAESDTVSNNNASESSSVSAPTKEPATDNTGTTTMSKIERDEDPSNEDSYEEEDDEEDEEDDDEEDEEGGDEEYDKESKTAMPLTEQKTAKVQESSDESSSSESEESDEEESDSESDSDQPQHQHQQSTGKIDVSGLKQLADNIKTVVKPGTFASNKPKEPGTAEQKPSVSTAVTQRPVIKDEDDDEKPLPKPAKKAHVSGEPTKTSTDAEKKVTQETPLKFRKKTSSKKNILDEDSDEFDENADESVQVAELNISNSMDKHETVSGSVVRAGYLPLGATRRLIDFTNKKHDNNQQQQQSKRKDKHSKSARGRASVDAETSVTTGAKTPDSSSIVVPTSASAAALAPNQKSAATVYLEVLGPEYLMEVVAPPTPMKKPKGTKDTIDPDVRLAYTEYCKAAGKWKDLAEQAVLAERKRIKKSDPEGYQRNKHYVEKHRKKRHISISKVTPGDKTSSSTSVGGTPVANTTAPSKRKSPDVPETEPSAKGQKIKTESTISGAAETTASSGSSSSVAPSGKVKSEKQRKDRASSVGAPSTALPDPPEWVQPWRDAYDMVNDALKSNVINSRAFEMKHPDAYKQNYAAYTLSMNRSEAEVLVRNIMFFAAANADRILSDAASAPTLVMEKGSQLRNMTGVLHNTAASVLGLPMCHVPGSEPPKTEVDMDDLM